MYFNFEASGKGEIMRAVRFHSYGDSGVLVCQDIDRPVAGPGQVVVKVAGAAFNPLDVAIRAGYVQQVFPVALPHVPNFDVAGVIAEAGRGVNGWREGDAVVAFLPVTAPGAAAEYAAVPAGVLAAAPRAAGLADAAALPSAGLTAWQSLFEHARLTAGQSILINGAGGAVGGYAVQLAKRAGATVTATASARSTDRIRSYGPDRIIDYTATPLPGAVAGQQFDVVLNLVRTSPEETAQLAGLAAAGGAFVSTTFPDFGEAGRGVRAVRRGSAATRAFLAGLVARVDAGDLRIDVAQRRLLSDLAGSTTRPWPGCRARPSWSPRLGSARLGPFGLGCPRPPSAAGRRAGSGAPRRGQRAWRGAPPWRGRS
jgi:NADPH:quinone reductase-like Zn-dependent oxidoreductase